MDLSESFYYLLSDGLVQNLDMLLTHQKHCSINIPDVITHDNREAPTHFSSSLLFLLMFVRSSTTMYNSPFQIQVTLISLKRIKGRYNSNI